MGKVRIVGSVAWVGVGWGGGETSPLAHAPALVVFNDGDGVRKGAQTAPHLTPIPVPTPDLPLLPYPFLSPATPLTPHPPYL